MSTRVCAKRAGVIWLAVKRCQISRYSLSKSGVRTLRRESGVRSTSVGRIASWASCTGPFALNSTLSRRGEGRPYLVVVQGRGPPRAALPVEKEYAAHVV